MADVVLHFQTDVDTILATKALKDGGVKAMLSRSMRGDSAHLCIILDSQKLDAAKNLLDNAGLSSALAA